MYTPVTPFRARRRLLTVAVLISITVLSPSCRVASDELAGRPAEAMPAPALDRAAAIDDLIAGDGTASCTAGLTEAGTELLTASRSEPSTFPAYDLEVDIDPSSGAVRGEMTATIPTTGNTLHFRVFPGMHAFDAGLEVDDVTVDGSPADYDLDTALLTVERNSDAGPAKVTMAFAYAIDQMAANESIFGALTGSTLEPDQVGLLGRTDTGMQLGHWFPVWLPDGIRIDPDPSGFGDIGAFPAAAICARITTEPGYQVVTGGVSLGHDGEAVLEGALGLRDFAILISNDLAMVSDTVDDVEVRVWGPADDPEALDEVLDFSVRSQRALVDAFGPYPWSEVDVVSAPLGGGVGGMEWPGMVWIERSMFGGGLPGLGGLGDLGEELGPFGSLFEEFDFESMLENVGGPALSTTLEWTIAHELGHEWWHALVGNDSIASPAVDEPLAQLAACLAMREIHPDNWLEICRAQTTDQYAQARGLGVGDNAAELPSDEFDSALQYGAVIYGKAPGFYFEVAELVGWPTLVDALRTFIAEHAFTLVSTNDLRQHLVAAAGDDGEAVDELWKRWFQQARGDEDIEPVDLFGGFGDLGGFGSFGDLDGSGLDGLEGLFGDGSPLTDEQFGELFESLLESLGEG